MGIVELATRLFKNADLVKNNDENNIKNNDNRLSPPMSSSIAKNHFTNIVLTSENDDNIKQIDKISDDL